MLLKRSRHSFPDEFALVHRPPAVISLIGGAINLMLCWIFIRPWGASGAAIATLLAGIVQAVLIFVLSQRHYRVPYPWLALSASAIAAVGTVAVSHFSFSSHERFSFSKLGFVAVASLLVGGIMLRPFWQKKPPIPATPPIS